MEQGHYTLTNEFLRRVVGRFKEDNPNDKKIYSLLYLYTTTSVAGEYNTCL